MQLVDTGHLVREYDIITTNENAKATLVIRDGSSIRLFPVTKLIIGKTEEKKLDQRILLCRFELAYGVIFGKFNRDNQRTQIETSSALVQIKEAESLIAQKKDGLSVSVTSGEVIITNEDEMLQLKAGEVTKGVKKKGVFSHKTKSIPYRVMITPAKNEIKLNQISQNPLIAISFQLENAFSKTNLHRAGDLYVSSNTKNIQFPKVQLNSRGYARIVAVLKTYELQDLEYDKIEMTAVIEGDYFDIGAGHTVIRVDSK